VSAKPDPHRWALIASASDDSRRLLSELARGEHLEPVVVRDGGEARAALQEHGAPALFVTELSLPRADGFTLLGDVRRIATPRQCPAVVVSAFPAFRATASRLKSDLGISEVLSSATPVRELRDAIHRAMVGAPAPDAPPASPSEAAFGEQARLARISSMGIVDDRPPDEALQKLVEDTARAFGVPIALVSLILEDRQWFKAYFGLDDRTAAARGTPRELSFCRHLVEGDTAQPLVVPDASVHPYFSAHPLVQQGLVRSYAGAPLVTPTGQVLGSLCIIDNEPLNIGPDDVDALVSLARRVAGELELMSEERRSVRAGEAGATLALLEAVCSSVETGILVLDSGRRVLLANRALADLFGIPAEQILKMTREELLLRVSTLCDDRVGFLRKLRVLPEGPFSARETFEIERPARRLVRWVAKPLRLPGGVGQLDIFDDVTQPAAG